MRWSESSSFRFAEFLMRTDERRGPPSPWLTLLSCSGQGGPPSAKHTLLSWGFRGAVSCLGILVVLFDSFFIFLKEAYSSRKTLRSCLCWINILTLHLNPPSSKNTCQSVLILYGLLTEVTEMNDFFEFPWVTRAKPCRTEPFPIQLRWGFNGGNQWTA